MCSVSYSSVYHSSLFYDEQYSLSIRWTILFIMWPKGQSKSFKPSLLQPSRSFTSASLKLTWDPSDRRSHKTPWWDISGCLPGKQDCAKKSLKRRTGKELRERKPRGCNVVVQEAGNLIRSNLFSTLIETPTIRNLYFGNVIFLLLCFCSIHFKIRSLWKILHDP